MWIKGGAGITSASMAAAYAVVAAWSCLLVWDGWRRGMFRRRLAAVDVGVATAVGLLALAWGSPGMRFGYGVLQGAAIVAGCALPARAMAVAMAALVGVEVLAVLTPSSGRITVTEFAAYASTLVVLAVAAAVAHRLLRLAADALDRRQAAAVDLASEQAEHRRMLHDTALATLTAIASGALDAQTDEVRARCARDAARLRLLVQGGQVGPGGLAAGLAAAVEDAAALGLAVRPICGELPDLDPGVVTGIAMAAREALNNAHRHAGAGEA
ncbi:MAG: hypothetical protein ACRDQW_13875, partial [Haloechinothrix sp.]